MYGHDETYQLLADVKHVVHRTKLEKILLSIENKVLRKIDKSVIDNESESWRRRKKYYRITALLTSCIKAQNLRHWFERATM